MKRLIFCSLALAAIPLAYAVSSFPPLKRESVLEAEVPAANPVVKLVRGAKIRFAPGQPSGRHRHPASVVGVVTEGSFHFQPEGSSNRLLETGDTFFEPAGQTILAFDNASTRLPAEITVFYLTDDPDRALIEPVAAK